MSRLAEDLTRGFSQHYSGTSLNCSLTRQKLLSSLNSPLDCTKILCQDELDLREGINFTLQLMPCSSPPAVRVVQQIEPQSSAEAGPGNFVNATISSSEIFALDLGGESTLAFPMFFGIGQHANRLSIGFEVS